MLDDVLDGDVDRKERLLREKFLGGSYFGFESKLESFCVIICVQNRMRKDVKCATGLTCLKCFLTK